MKPSQIVDAYKAIRELDNVPMPYRAARQVASLKKRLDEEFNVVRSMEIALAAEYGGHIEGSSYHFENAHVARDFADKLNAAMQQEDMIEFPKVDLSEISGRLSISPFAVEALDGIVKFEEE